MATVSQLRQPEFDSESNSKAAAIADGRRRAEEARTWLLERIHTAQRLDAFLSKLDFDELVKLEGGIARIKHEKRQEAEEERKQEEARQAAAQKIREMAAEAGLNVDIAGAQPAKRKAHRPNINPEKYAIRFQDTNQVHYWSGMGRAPTVFAHAMKKGGYKKDELLNHGEGRILTMAKSPV